MEKPRSKDNFNLIGFPPELRVRFRQHCERSGITVVQGAIPLFEKYLRKHEFTKCPFHVRKST